MKKTLALLTAALAILVSCQKEELVTSKEAAAPEIQQQQSGRLISATKVGCISAEEALKTFNQREWTDLLEDYSDSSITEVFKTRLLGIDLINCQILTYKIKYASRAIVGGELVPDTMTGEVSFVVDGTGAIKKRYIESVTLYNTFFNTTCEDIIFGNEWCRPRALYNALVVFPYYQGGDKSENCICAPFDFIAKGRQALDCELAALELVDSLENVSMLPCYYTENIGISNGGGAALAAQYLLENDAEYRRYQDLINLRSSYVGEGNICLANLFPCLTSTYEPGLLDILDMNKLAPCGALSIIALTYTAWKDKYFEGINVEEYFSQEFLDDRDSTGRNKLERLLANEGNMSEWFEAETVMPVNQMINPELLDFNEEDSTYTFNSDPRILQLYEAFKENEDILSGWHPQTPLIFAHSYSDEFLLYKDTYKVYASLSTLGLNKNVEMRTAFGLNHLLASFYFLATDVLLSKHQWHED